MAAKISPAITSIAIDMPSESSRAKNDHSNVNLTWRNLSYSLPAPSGKIELPARFVLNNVSGYVRSGEVVAIMGSSGAGNI
jgi:ABC-type multidrug transport system fused ATPase/permease subunit